MLPLTKSYVHKNFLILVVESTTIQSVLFFLKKHINFQFSLLTAISGVDYPHRANRFAVVYELLSLPFQLRVRVKVFVNEYQPLLSCKTIFEGATWWEREIWDLFGVFFIKNNEMRRILTDYGFEGHPLRKDFPLSGYVESRYDDSLKRVVCEPIEHSQAFRTFSFKAGWSIQH